jgi:hypothetical protein
MRLLALLLVTLSACSTAPVAGGRSQTPPQASADPVVEFLLTAAATDFHEHRPPDPVRFRQVRVGHKLTPAGEDQYLLCGEFLPAQHKAEWISFATIKTDPYEQWLGGSSTSFCHGPSFTWYTEDDLSASLQSRLEALR